MVTKKTTWVGTRWEEMYGYPQVVQVDDTLYVSGQLSLDENGDIVGGAPLDKEGKIIDHSNMEIQMRQTYANAEKVIAKHGGTMHDVVEEIVFVTDMDKAFDVAGRVRREAYKSQRPEVASTIFVTPRLALPDQLIEIKLVAKLK